MKHSYYQCISESNSNQISTVKLRFSSAFDWSHPSRHKSGFQCLKWVPFVSLWLDNHSQEPLSWHSLQRYYTHILQKWNLPILLQGRAMSTFWGSHAVQQAKAMRPHKGRRQLHRHISRKLCESHPVCLNFLRIYQHPLLSLTDYKRLKKTWHS